MFPNVMTTKQTMSITKSQLKSIINMLANLKVYIVIKMK